MCIVEHQGPFMHLASQGASTEDEIARMLQVLNIDDSNPEAQRVMAAVKAGGGIRDHSE